MDLTNKLYKVFLIAGSEPLGTAGMQADIKSISACGGYAAGAITCIVDEDTIKVKVFRPSLLRWLSARLIRFWKT